MAASTKETVAVVPKQPLNPPTEGYMTPSQALSKQLEQVNRLPSGKSWPFGYGALLLPINAGLVGLIGNSFFRRMLMVRKGLLLTSLPSALLPALVMTPAWMRFLTNPILLGDLRCTVCADIRGGVVNFLLGAVYPVILAAPLSAALAKRYETAQVPVLSIKHFKRKKFVEFWAGKIRYFKGQFIAIAIFQTALGMFIANSQMRVVREEIGQKLAKVEH